YAWWRLISEAAGVVPGGWKKDVVRLMEAEGAEDRIGVAFSIGCAQETALQTPDAGPDGVGGILRVVFGAAAMMAQEFGDLFVFGEGFGLFWLGGVLRLKDGFQFSFFAVEAAHGFDVVQGKAA